MEEICHALMDNFCEPRKPVPFKTSVLTVVIVPTLGKFIVTEFYVDSNSGVQRAFDIYAKTNNITTEQIWG